jgi:hypothetical protein
MSPRPAATCVVVLAFLHVVLAVATARGTSVTVDEAGHIASGIAHHQQGSFASYRVNPPPARWLATLPIVLFQDPPKLTPLVDKPGLRPEGAYSVELANALGSRYRSVVFTARLFNIALSAVGLVLLYLIGASTFGRPGGLLAAAFYAINPNLVAHAAVLTSDMPATVGILAFTWALLRYSRRPSFGVALGAGALLGVAQLTKFSALVLYPVTLVVFAAVVWRDRNKARARIAHALTVLLTSILVLDAGYGFRGTGGRLDEIAFVSRSFTGAPVGAQPHPVGNRFRGTVLGRFPVPVPRDYLIGIDLQRRDFEGVFRSYLDGRWYDHGFWFYYAYALALKTPLSTLALFAIGIHRVVSRVFRPSPSPSRLVVLLIPIAFFVFISSQTGFSHHLRYVLPVVPFIALGIGALGRHLRASRWLRGVVLCGLGASAYSVITVVPHGLSYFNALGGGPMHGDEHLIDSNVDWGQDLGRLAEWYRTHRDRPLRLAYFGGIDPHCVGLEYTLPPLAPEPGRFVLSVNFVRGMRFVAVDGASREVALPEGRYDFFSQWEPSERIGTSIRVYEVSLDQANAARRRLNLAELTDARAVR